MSRIVVTLAGVDADPVEQTLRDLQTFAEDVGIEFDVSRWGPSTPTDAKNILTNESVEDPEALWLQQLPTESLWDLHGEACRRIVEEVEAFPKLYGRVLRLTQRYDVDLKAKLLSVEYHPESVVAFKTKGAPPFVIHSAPFSYDPFHEYYTEVHRESPRTD